MPPDKADTHATPSKGIEHDKCTLTDAEQEAMEWCIFQQATPQRIAVTLRGLLERLGGER